MKTFAFIILLSISFSCGREKGKEKATKIESLAEKDALCFSEEERAKQDIRNGSLNYIVWLPLSTNFNKAEEIKKQFEKENIKIEFYLNSCLVQKGIQNCYEVYMNSEFEKVNGKSTVSNIINEFDKFGIKTFKIEKRSLHDLTYKKTAYNSRLAQWLVLFFLAGNY